MQHVIYVTYETLYGTRSTRENLLDELRPLALAPLLKLLAALNDHLRSDENRPTMSVQYDLLRLFYTSGEIQAMANLDTSVQPVVLHRQQLLFLLKEALYVCSESGLDISKDFSLLAKALLRANDLLAHVFTKGRTVAHRALLAAAHFFSIQEAGVFHSYEYKMLRSYWMMQRTFPSLISHKPFFDIPRLFAAETHLDLLDFHILQFMTMTSFIKEVARTRPTSPIDLPETWFRTTDFSGEVISDYWKYTSALSIN